MALFSQWGMKKDGGEGEGGFDQGIPISIWWDLNVQIHPKITGRLDFLKGETSLISWSEKIHKGTSVREKLGHQNIILLA